MALGVDIEVRILSSGFQSFSKIVFDPEVRSLVDLHFFHFERVLLKSFSDWSIIENGHSPRIN